MASAITTGPPAGVLILHEFDIHITWGASLRKLHQAPGLLSGHRTSAVLSPHRNITDANLFFPFVHEVVSGQRLCRGPMRQEVLMYAAVCLFLHFYIRD